MNIDKPYQTTSTRIPTPIYEKIKLLGFKQRKSMNQLIIQSLREFLIKYSKKEATSENN